MTLYSEITQNGTGHATENRTRIARRKKPNECLSRGTLFRRKDSPVWWINVAVCGKRTRISTRTTDRAEAEAILAVAQGRAAEGRMQRMVAKTVAAISGSNPKAEPFDWARARWTSLNSRERQAIVFAIYEGRCFYCANPVTIPEAREMKLKTRAVLDHRIPVIAGGSDLLDNLVLACHQCNMRKHDKNPEHHNALPILAPEQGGGAA